MKSLANKTAYRIILVLLTTVTRVWSTSVAIAFTPAGIVLGTDSRITDRDPSLGYLGASSSKKFFIIQDRIVVASIGISNFVFNGPKGSYHYNFLTWMNELQGSIPANVPVGNLAEIIKTESAKVFAVVPDLIASDQLKQHDSTEFCRMLAQYVITGYDAGIPKLYLVEFDLTWDGISTRPQFIGPRIAPIDLTLALSNFQVQFFGFKEALADLANRDSYAYQEAMRRSPIAFRDTALKHGNLPLEETVSLIRTFIGIEERVKPNDVAGRIRIVNILPNGRASEEINHTSLTKTAPRKSDKQH